MNPTAPRTLFEIYPPNALATTPLGLRVNELVYGRLDAIDSVTGAMPGDAEQQAKQAVVKLHDLLGPAGASPADVEEITAVYDSEGRFGLIPDSLRSALPGTSLAAITETVGVQPHGHVVELHCRARIGQPGVGPTAAAMVRIGGRPVGQVMGPVAFAPMLLGGSASNALGRASSLEQLRSALEQAGDFLEAAGSSWQEVARVTVLMNPVDMGAMNTAWAEVFPDPEMRPPHKYVPTPLPEGCLAAVQVMAIVGASPPKVIELDTIRHGDWMTMAALTGGVVTSSRIIAPRTPDALAYTQRVVDGIEEVLAKAGGGLQDLTQVTAFIGGPSYRALVEDEFRRRMGGTAGLPVFHFIEADIGGVKTPRMEIMALIDP